MNAQDATDVVISIVHASDVEETIRCLRFARGRSHQERLRRGRSAGQRGGRRFGSGRALAPPACSRHRPVPSRWLRREPERGDPSGPRAATCSCSTPIRACLLGPSTRFVEFMDAHPEVAIAGPAIRGFDGRPQGSAWRLMTIPVQLVWALTLGTFGAVVLRGSRPRRVGAVSASAMIARRRALDCVGAFDESYFMFGEEADLARRLRRAGYDEWYVPAAHVFHARTTLDEGRLGAPGERDLAVARHLPRPFPLPARGPCHSRGHRRRVRNDRVRGRLRGAPAAAVASAARACARVDARHLPTARSKRVPRS